MIVNEHTHEFTFQLTSAMKRGHDFNRAFPLPCGRVDVLDAALD